MYQSGDRRDCCYIVADGGVAVTSRYASIKKGTWIFLLAILAFVLFGLDFRLRSTRPSSAGFEVATSLEDRDPFKLHPNEHISRPAGTSRHQWRVTSGERRPDGVLKTVLLVNDAFPGPTIEARSGDRIVIEVENRLQQSISIHWHGLTMQHTNDMDGAAGVTQDAILPGAIFVYDFTISQSQSGTFWYHAHSGVQRADGLFGGLVVHEPREASNEQQTPAHTNEFLLLIGDWYHRQADDVLDSYLSADSFGMEPVPDSVLVNGRGKFNCSNAVPARPLDCQPTTISSLTGTGSDVSQPTKLRFVNTGVYSGITIRLANAFMSVIALDGGNTVDHVRGGQSFGVLHPGERVDVVIEGSLPESLEVHIDTTSHKYMNPALTTQQSFPFAKDISTPFEDGISLNEADEVDLNVMSSSVLASAVPAEADQMMVLYVVSEQLAHLDYLPTGSVNRTSWKPQTPALNKLDRTQWNEHQFVPQIAFDAEKPLWVDLVVNNLDEEDHAFHLHGHDFFVMSTYSSPYNWGSYNPMKDAVAPGGSYSSTPRKKDTVAIPRRGYAVLRFQADNPGLWMFHCHVMWHLAAGMAMVFEIG